MKSRTAHLSYSSPIAFMLALPLLIVGLTLTGCDSGGSDDGLPIEGTWEELAEEAPLYLEITSSTYTEYETYDVGGCFYQQSGDIVGRDGNTYTLADPDNEDNTVTLRMVVEGDELTLQNDYEAIVFERTNIDPSMLDRCGQR